MITEQYLLSIGFESEGVSWLPRWYTIFEAEDVKAEAPCYMFSTEHYNLRIYFSRQGTFGEVWSNDPFDNSVSYVALRNHEDVINAICNRLGIDISDALQ